MALRRRFDREPVGNPLFVLATLYKGEFVVAQKRMVYNQSYTDERIYKYLGLPAKSQADRLELKLLIEWVKGKAVKYEENQ